MSPAPRLSADSHFRIWVLSLAVVMIALPLGMLLNNQGARVTSDAAVANRIIPIGTPVPVSAECVPTGCNQELCVSSADAPIETTCLWQEQYTCLRDSTCEIQADGQCGWSETTAYLACLNKVNASSDDVASAATCGNNICDPGEADVITPGGCDAVDDPRCLGKPSAIIPGTCPADCNSQVLPTLTPPTDPPEPQNALSLSGAAEKVCIQSGGAWRTFPDSCADTCSSQLNRTACLDVITESCDCPSGCWNGNACVPNPITKTLPDSQPPTIITEQLPDGVINRFYTASITAEDFDPGDELVLLATGLPAGLTLNTCYQQSLSLGSPKEIIRCTLDGIPTTSGIYSVGITVEDASETTVNKTLRLEIYSTTSIWLNSLKSWLGL